MTVAWAKTVDRNARHQSEAAADVDDGLRLEERLAERIPHHHAHGQSDGEPHDERRPRHRGGAESLRPTVNQNPGEQCQRDHDLRKSKGLPGQTRVEESPRHGVLARVDEGLDEQETQYDGHGHLASVALLEAHEQAQHQG